jgi:hypothetical protein
VPGHDVSALDRVVRLVASSSPLLWSVLALAVLLVVVLEAARAWVRRFLVSRRLRNQAGRALEAEAWALELLSRAGYAVRGAQVRGSYDLLIDGRRVSIALRADYIVERRGRLFVAEVKSGELAPSIETAATRRQLLEYRIAFAVDGALLVDGEAGTVREVVFPLGAQARPTISRQASLAPF